MQEGARPGPSLTRKVVYSLIPLIALLALIETGFRLFPHEDAGETVADYTLPDPDLIWRLRPYDRGPAATNQLGLRDGPFNARADYKVLLLGDSVSWGHRIVNLSDTYPYLLEIALNRRDPAHAYEVINAGVPGYSTFQEAAYLRLHGLALEPDLVVLQFCLNDVVERYHTLMAYGGDNVFLGVDTRQGVPGIFGVLVRHSRAAEGLARLLQSRSRNREAYEVEKLARDELSAELTDAWEIVLGEIDEIRRLTAENDIPLLLLIAPYRFQLADPTRRRQPQDLLIDYARTHGMPYVDLLAEFSQEAGDQPLFLDPSHFSIHGHHRVQALLVDPVIDLLRSE